MIFFNKFRYIHLA